MPSSPEACPAPLLPRPFKVRRRRRELADTWTLEVAPDDGGPAIAFQPGQFNMAYLPGVGEIPVSISGASGRSLLHTIRSVGPVSAALAALAPGSPLGLRGPYGSAWPVEAARGGDVVILAGGLGLPPLRPAILELLRRRKEFRRLVLLYGARTPSDLIFKPELAAWRKKAEVLVTVDRADLSWRGRIGVVSHLLDEAGLDAARTTAFVCGPNIMMRVSVADLAHRGVAPGRIFLSLERNMKCAVGFCGHCQLGPAFVCKDGPVVPYARLQPWIDGRAL